MAHNIAGFRSRAASFFQPPHRGSISEKHHKNLGTSRHEQLLNEKASIGVESPELGRRDSQQSSGQKTHHTSGDNAVAHDREAQRIVRTIPTWVQTLDEEDGSLAAEIQVPEPPVTAHIPQQNAFPTPGFLGSQPGRGHIHDREREWTPPLPRGSVRATSSRWKAFTTSSMYPRYYEDYEGETVTEEWLMQNGADYSRPWMEGREDGDPEKGNSSIFRFHRKRRAWYLRLQRTVLRSPIVPMIIRMTVFIFSLVALGLAASIHHMTRQNMMLHPVPSTNMAIIVDAVALVYLIYIAYDEYAGKPLGLRSARAKMRLLFLDLFFIVFDSANLSLAFEALETRRNCGPVCARQKGLVGVLLIALVAWLMTFSISVMRVVERVNSR